MFTGKLLDNTMKRIIFINQVTGPLMIDMLNVFIEKKCDVILYTGEISKTSDDLHGKVKVRKLISYKKDNNFKRVFTWISFSVQVLMCLMYDLDKNTRIYLSSNPPMATWITLLFKNKSYIHIYDVYPNALLALKYITTRSIVYKLFLYLNNKSFTKTRKVFTPSLGMKNMLITSVAEEKIKIIPWWADTEFIKPIEKIKNTFISKYELEGKFVVMYSGNFGLTHNIEKVLDTALFLKNEHNIQFIIIGNGPKKKVVDLFQKKHNLRNLLVLPFQNERTLPYSLAASNLSIVLDSFSSNDGGGSTASIPSKTYYLMAAGAAIYAESDNTSELHWLINKYDLGLCDSSRAIQKFSEFILYCRDNEEIFRKYQKNSRQASLNFTKENASLLYNEIVQD